MLRALLGAVAVAVVAGAQVATVDRSMILDESNSLECPSNFDSDSDLDLDIYIFMFIIYIYIDTYIKVYIYIHVYIDMCIYIYSLDESNIDLSENGVYSPIISVRIMIPIDYDWGIPDFQTYPYESNIGIKVNYACKYIYI